MSTAIGVFDSGVGGLTVLRDLVQAFPDQQFIYLGDTARLPYGAKSPETIRQYSIQNLKFLANLKVQAVVIACNSASTQVPENEWEGIPVYNVIDPGVQAALGATESGRIGLMATRATVESHAYQSRLRERVLQGRPLEVFEQACPLFVPLAEEGWVDDPITNLIVYRYVQPLLARQVDTLILGCTHYPILRSSIEKVAGKNVQLVDSGMAVVELLKKDFSSGRLKTSGSGGVRILMTDLSKHLQKWARELLSLPVDFEIEKVNL